MLTLTNTLTLQRKTYSYEMCSWLFLLEPAFHRWSPLSRTDAACVRVVRQLVASSRP